ncbi:AI-2E family transporter [Parasphingorhabdus sp.]|uniref:AI-2E family transporter n=1 Tax=Parasphingorhabdus sp. TaxID=2709688 RepID=UPI003A8DA0AF
MASKNDLAAADAAAPSPKIRRGRARVTDKRLFSTAIFLMALGLFMALPFVLSAGAVFFRPLFASIVIMLLLLPLANILTKLGIPNTISSFLSVLAFLVLVALGFMIILQPALELAQRFPDITNILQERMIDIRQFTASVSQMGKEFSSTIGESQGQQVVVATPTVMEEAAYATPAVLVEFLLIILMSYFMLESRLRFKRTILQKRSNLATRLKAARTGRSITEDLSRYIGAVTAINVAVGVVVAFGAWAMDIESPMMWGGLAAILNFIPYLGPMLMAVLLFGFGAASSGDLAGGLAPTAAYIALQVVEANLITPTILGRRFAMNPVVILLAISYFTWIWGLAGALIAVPMLIVGKALVDQLGSPNILGFILGEPLFESPAQPTDQTQGGQPQ